MNEPHYPELPLLTIPVSTATISWDNKRDEYQIINENMQTLQARIELLADQIDGLTKRLLDLEKRTAT